MGILYKHTGSPGVELPDVRVNSLIEKGQDTIQHKGLVHFVLSLLISLVTSTMNGEGSPEQFEARW